MKKFMYMAVCTATGIVMVSCDKESFGTTSFETNSSKKLKVENIFSKEGDTIIQSVTDPGPGDEVVPIKPPKP